MNCLQWVRGWHRHTRLLQRPSRTVGSAVDLHARFHTESLLATPEAIMETDVRPAAAVETYRQARLPNRYIPKREVMVSRTDFFRH